MQCEELARFRRELREHLDRQVSAQLHNGEAGVRAVETAREVIVKRLKADPELWKELVSQPRRWWQRKSSMTGVA